MINQTKWLTALNLLCPLATLNGNFRAVIDPHDCCGSMGRRDSTLAGVKNTPCTRALETGGANHSGTV